MNLIRTILGGREGGGGLRVFKNLAARGVIMYNKVSNIILVEFCLGLISIIRSSFKISKIQVSRNRTT